MELNRDINVAATAAFVERLLSKKDILREEIRYVDAFSASGIRGLRIAGEIGIHSTMNDWSHEAFELIKENIKINGLEEKAQATRRNANVLLHEQRFHIVDVDPFGTPSPYLDAAASSAYSMLSVTATDTAPLCGAHLNSGIRKYASVPLNTEYHSEMGLRVLLEPVQGACKTRKGMLPCSPMLHATTSALTLKSCPGPERLIRPLSPWDYGSLPQMRFQETCLWACCPY